MKTIYKLSIWVIALVLLSATTFAQAPRKMSYQAVVRNGNDLLIKSQAIGVQISIVEGSNEVYVETHNALTNANGLLTIVIGEGSVVFGSMNSIEWGNGAHYIKSQIDPTGGTNYTIVGKSQLLSVPYALFAESANKGPNDTNWELNSPNIYRNSNVGINTTNTSFALSVRDTLSGSAGNAAVIKVQGGATSGGTYIGLVGEIIGTNGSNRGIYGWSHGTSAGQNIGTYGQSTGSTVFNVGALGHTSGIAPEAAGVYGFTTATGADNYGVLGASKGVAGTRNYGVIGYAENGATDYGVYGWTDGTGTNYAGYFEGRVTITEDFRSTKTLVGSNDYAGISKATAGSTANASYIGFIGEVDGANTAASNRGLYGWSHGANTVGQNVGVYGQSTNSTVYNVGNLGHASGTATEAAGVYGFTDATGTYNYGVSGSAGGAGTENYGLVGYANGGSSKNYGVYGWTGPTSGPGVTGAFYAGYFQGDVTITGNLNVTGSIAKGSGTFKIDHPLDPENKYLVHSFVESPDMMNIYNGNVTTDANGYVTVTMPEYFEAANKEFRYQLTVMGTFAQAIIKEKMAGNTFVIQTNQPNVEVSWQVTGVRADKYAEQNRVVVEEEKATENKGTYLHPEAYGASEDRSENAKHKLNTPKRLTNSTPNTVVEEEKSANSKLKVPQTPVGGGDKVDTDGVEKDAVKK